MASNKNIGNHNRNYYFTVKVTNNAFLTNIEHIDILVDDSPPEVGVVFEGRLFLLRNVLFTNIEHIGILVDDSPPEVGVVFEGRLF